MLEAKGFIVLIDAAHGPDDRVATGSGLRLDHHQIIAPQQAFRLALTVPAKNHALNGILLCRWYAGSWPPDQVGRERERVPDAPGASRPREPNLA